MSIRVIAITDRRRMVAPAVLASRDARAIADAFAAAIARAIAGLGDAVAIQVREKDADGRLLVALVRAARAVTPHVVVNDRADVAIAADAAGVHLPERGLDVASVRALPGFGARRVGVSRHDPRALAADGADLVQLGPIFATPDKGPPLGVDALALARAALPPAVALVAVGGIDGHAAARAAFAAGADAVAAIRAAWDGTLAGLLE